MLQLAPPIDNARVLLHSCCAPCSGAILECMLANGIRPTVFFSNSNIAPYGEYNIRRDEVVRYCQSQGLEVVDDIYEHEAWLDFALHRQNGLADNALAQCPERGARCMECFRFRMARAANYAASHGYDLLTTSLASSRWKDLEQVNAAGEEAVNSVRVLYQSRGQACGLLYWPQNWRKGGLQPRRSEIIKEQNFYNQSYCGCEFSERH